MTDSAPIRVARDIRSHQAIIRNAKAQHVHEALVARGFRDLKLGAVTRWGDRDSIPADFWRGIAAAGFATVDELADYAEAQRITQPQAGEPAAA